MNQLFSGAATALITPFNNDKTVDIEALKKLVDYQIDNCTDFLVVLGTTAEAATLSCEERQQVVDTVIQQNNKRVPVVAGIGGNNTAEVVKTIRNTDFQGIDGILSVVPYYNKPTQEGIYRHYMAVAETSPVPVILYNVPGRTGTNMTAETTLRLARASEKFVAVKEASGNFQQISKILHNRPDNFLVLSGDDPITVPMMALGANGAISVVGNALPKQASDMVHAALEGDFAKAAQLQLNFVELLDALFAEGNPGGVKALMHQMQLIENEVRLPLCKVSEQLYKRISELYTAF